MNKMKVLVSGFDGFIGSHLIEELKKDYDVFGITNYSVAKKIKADIPFNYVDVTKHFQVKNVLNEVRPDIIINLCAQSSVSRSFDRPEEYINTNTIGVINMAENAMRCIPNLKLFIQASTPEVYGRMKEFPIKETANASPTTPYAVSKLSADHYLMYMHQAYDFPVVLSRHANCYGRKGGIFSHLGVIENIVTQMLKGNEINLGDGEVRRDFIYIDDVVRWYKTLIEKGKPGNIYNFGWGRAYRIEDVAETAARLLNWKGTINYNTLPKRPGEMDCIELDTSKANKELGIAPSVSMEDGLKKVIEYWRLDEGSNKL